MCQWNPAAYGKDNTGKVAIYGSLKNKQGQYTKQWYIGSIALGVRTGWSFSGCYIIYSRDIHINIDRTFASIPAAATGRKRSSGIFSCVGGRQHRELKQFSSFANMGSMERVNKPFAAYFFSIIWSVTSFYFLVSFPTLNCTSVDINGPLHACFNYIYHQKCTSTFYAAARVFKMYLTLGYPTARRLFLLRCIYVTCQSGEATSSKCKCVFSH